MVDIGKLPPVVQARPTRPVSDAKNNRQSPKRDNKRHSQKNKADNDKDNDPHIDEFA